MRVRMFAALRELAGGSEVEVDASGAHTVGDLLGRLSQGLGPTFDAIMGAGSVILNGEPVGRDHPLNERDEVALLPPVSGGDAPSRRRRP
jgi:MoaD family protein